MAGFDPDVFGVATTGASAQGGFDPDVFGAPTQKPKTLAAAEPPKKQGSGTGSDVMDAGNALGTGFWRGAARVLGTPVDAVANVIDLGKAGIGGAYQAVTGKVAPDALQLGDRSKVVGSGDWLIDQARKTSGGRLMVDPINPEYEGGLIQTAGAGLNAIVAPNTARQAVNQGVIGVTSALAGKTVGDATGNPALAIAAGLAPSGIQQAATAATKFAVRGGEQGRREMEQRIQDLKNAGIENPTLGLASGNKLIGGVENLLQSTPGAIGIMGKSRDAAIQGLQNKAEEAAALASSNRGAMESGVAIQQGIRDFRDAYRQRQEGLYGRLDQHIDPLAPTSVANTQATLAELNPKIPGASNVSNFFVNKKLRDLADAIAQDTAGSPQSVMVYPRPPVAGGGLMNTPIPQDPVQVVIPQGPSRGTLPWEAVQKTRTMAGREIAENPLVTDVSNSKWRALYGGISEDMQNAANAAGPQATQAFNRATDYTRAGAQRLERVAPFAEARAPEQAFTAMVNASRENVSTLQAVKKTLPEGARGSIAGTIIERLGKATNGAQNDVGSAWSPETFLTNWNRMTPKAREELFSGFPNAGAVKADVDAVAKAASMMRESSKMWANPSGTGANTFARGLLGAVGIGGGASALGLLNPMVPLGAGSSLLGANRLAAGLTSKDVVEAMARRNSVSPAMLEAQYRSLIAPGLLSVDQQP